MRIALVVTGGLHPSGREQVIPALLWLLDRLSRTHDVHAFALRHLDAPTTYKLCGATVHDLGRPAGRLRQWQALRRALVANGPFDVLHGYWADPAGLLVAIAGRVLAIPAIVTCDSGEFASLPLIGYGLQRSLRGRAVVATACRLARAVHVTSEYMAAAARAHRLRPVTIPLGIDLARIPCHPPPAEGPPWRLLQVAALNRVKDQSLLLEAVARICRTVPVHLDLVGEDTLGGALQRLAVTLGQGDCVSFHGFVAQERLDSFRRSAHVYVQSSQHEAAGVAVLEAAAAGLPIVGTRVGYVSDWASSAAVAVRPGDVDQMAAAILEVILHRDRRVQLAEAARAKAMAANADDTTAALVQLYDDVASHG